MPRRISATYRLQVTSDFPLSAVRERVPYLHDLGVSHLYLSPLLAARTGTTHGYDVVDHARLNPELGDDETLRALARDLHDRGMGIVLDIVPNHMSASAENPYWDDVLMRGRGSRYAEWFDIEWDAPNARGKVVLPVLSDELPRVIERGEIKLRIRDSGARIAWFDHSWPLDPGTLPKEVQLAQFDPAGRPAVDEWVAGDEGKRRLAKLIGAQHYRLAHWRRAPDDINYRRFFEVNDLVAVRLEDEDVFRATHGLILDWVREGILDGLRVDHVDGLRDPSWYLATLRQAVDSSRHRDAPERFPIFVEKILSGDERLPADWPVDGSTGYDFMNEVEDVMLAPEGMRAIEAAYRGLRHNPSLRFDTVARDGKRGVLRGALRPDVMRVARLASEWSKGTIAPAAAARAIIEVMVHLPVYRTYIAEPGVLSRTDRSVLAEAFEGARAATDVDPFALELLERAFLDKPRAKDRLRTELVMRFQQTSGPATAKGVEDTALYVYLPLASRNEVGGVPDRELEHAAQRLHDRNAERARRWPVGLNATNTHDTKRSADLRARLSALSEVPEEWARHVSRWRRLNRQRKRTVRGKPAPDTNAEYLFYQSLLGLWPAPRPQRRVDDLPDAGWFAQATERLSAYMLKAVREAKTRTSWTESDEQYEAALAAFVRESLTPSDDAPFTGDVARLTARVADPGFARAVARMLIQVASPGVPDVYQGDELWNFTLVDPDNRRPVDFDRAISLLGRSDASEDLVRDAFGGGLGEDRVKQALLARLLRLRRERQPLFTVGEYLPLAVPNGLFAFARRHQDELVIAIARTRALPKADGQESQSQLTWPAHLTGRWMSGLTGREIELVHDAGQVRIWPDELLPQSHPCDLILRTRR